jgi:hypothetical protein
MSVTSNEKKSALGRFAIKRNTEKKADKKAEKKPEREKKKKEDKEPGRKLASSDVSITAQAW